jgi:chromosome segregation ATPase
MKYTRIVLQMALIAWVGEAGFSADVSPNEARLRESVKGLMVQLRTIQAERDTLDAAKTEHEQKAKELGEKLAALTKSSEAEREGLERTVSGLRSKVADLEKENGGLKADLAQAVGVGNRTAERLKKKEAEGAKLGERVTDMERKASADARKNLELHRLAKEILDRYEKFGLGTALTAREPFVGTTRVRLQNLVQDYSDKLSEQRIKD